ncbi:MAG: hypothetical protein OSA98_15420 [Rubripirellula sp.]|nr:hypothetical protein [Rubripirellula sp.]
MANTSEEGTATVHAEILGSELLGYHRLDGFQIEGWIFPVKLQRKERKILAYPNIRCK